MAKRFYCIDVTGTVHSISNDPYTNDLKVCCKRLFVWHDATEEHRFIRQECRVKVAPGPATCISCIANETEV